MTVLDILINYRQAFLGGLWVSLQLALIVWLAGVVIGGVLGFLSAQYKIEVGIITRTISFILSGVPILVFLFWLHYPAQAMFDLVIDPFYTAAATLAIVNVFGVADLVRNTLDEFPKQYLTAAQVCGLSAKQTALKVQLPIVIRGVLPGLILLQVTMLHTTLFASLISVEEIFRVAQRINAQIYRPVEIYTALGVFFLLVCLPLNGLAIGLKKRFMRDLSER